MISIEKLTKRYGTLTALEAVSLEVGKGEFFGLVGPNGAGKSTLMNILSGYLYPDEGTLKLDGQVLSAQSQQARRVLGLVPQSLALYEEFTAVANLEVFGGIHGIPRHTLKDKIRHWLERVQLWDRRHDKVKGFSGGMKRRLNLVASLLHDPAILLCDEPTVGVDPQSRNAIFDFLEELNRGGMTVIYTTHYMEEVERLCRRIAIIDTGRIIASGSRNELVAKLPYKVSISFEADRIEPSLLGEFGRFGEVAVKGNAGTLTPQDGFRLSRFYELLEQRGVPYNRFHVHQPSLEALFLHLTGKQIRE